MKQERERERIRKKRTHSIFSTVAQRTYNVDRERKKEVFLRNLPHFRCLRTKKLFNSDFFFIK